MGLNAVASGSTSLGVKDKNGVVIATEKKLPTCLIDETTVQKIVHLTENIAVVYSGMGPDFRVLCRKGRKAAQAYYRVYQEIIPDWQADGQREDLPGEAIQRRAGAGGRRTHRAAHRQGGLRGRDEPREHRGWHRWRRQEVQGPDPRRDQGLPGRGRVR